MPKKVLLNDPVINEIAFDYLFALSAGQREKLNAKELRAVKSAKKCRHFVETISLDEKLFLLAKLGCGFSIVFHNGNPIATKEVKELYVKYKGMKNVQIVDDMAAHKIVVTSDRTLINFLNVLSDLSHSDTYLLNLDYHKVGHFINNWKPERKPDVIGISDALEGAKLINKLTLTAIMEVKHIKGVSGIADLDLNILMLLYDNRTKYVSRSTIDNYFGGAYKKTIIAAAIKRLELKILIDRNPTTKILEYQITALGNTAVMDFHRKNLSQTV